MNQHPTLIQALTRDRVEALRRSAAPDGSGPRMKRRHRDIGTVRHATGWLLVDVGLRLAVHGSKMSRPVAQREIALSERARSA
jgi:hypothetical protein